MPHVALSGITESARVNAQLPRCKHHLAILKTYVTAYLSGANRYTRISLVRGIIAARQAWNTQISKEPGLFLRQRCIFLCCDCNFDLGSWF